MRADIQAALENFRTALDLSQEKLAQRLNVTVRTVARWEATGAVPLTSIARLLMLAQETEQLESEVDFGHAIVEGLHLNEKASASIARLLDRARKGKAA